MAPRLPSGRGSKGKSNVTPFPGEKREAAIGDNSMHGEEAERVQLISIVSQLSKAEDEIEVAKAPLKAAQKKRSQIIGLGKAAGFTAKELTQRLDEMKRGTRENAEQIAREAKQRRWLGILDADQQKLILGDSAPQEAKDEAHWGGEGYKAGLRGLEAALPEGLPPRMDQPYLAGHERGRADYMAALEANVPQPRRSRAQEVAEQAARDFAEDQAAERATIADDRLAEKREERAVKEALETLGEETESEEVV